MIQRCYFFIFIFLLFGCNEKDTTSYPEGILFPKDTHTILQINKKKEFLTAIEQNAFWKNYMPSLPNTPAKEILKSLPDSLTYWLTYTDKKFYIISSVTDLDTLSGWETNRNNYFVKEIKNNKWYYKKSQNRFIISENADLNNFIEAKTQALPSSLQKLNTTIDKQVIANLFIKKSISKSFFQPIFNTDVTEKFQDWLAIDLLLNEKSIKLNGTSLIQHKDSTNISFSETSSPQIAKWKQIAPMQISQVYSYTLNPDSQKDNLPSFAKSIYGINIFLIHNHSFVAFNSADFNLTLQQLPIISESIFEEHTLYQLSDTEKEVSLFLKPFISNFSPSFAFSYEGYLILAEDETTLKQLITDIKHNTMLLTTNAFQSLDSQMASSASETFIASLRNNDNFSDSYPNITKNYALASLQFFPTEEFYILNFISEETSDLFSANIPKKQFEVTLEDTLISPPTIVKNHNTGEKEIILQNSKNELVLLGKNGETLFQIPLDTPINSPIYQIDIFKNKKLQYTFTTQHSIWIIDRNGQQVSPYPKKFKGNLSPLEVYDYDNTKKYRLATVEDSTKIHLLDIKGNKITGFSVPKSKAKVLQTPKHFRVKSKDYIVYPTNDGSLQILHRNGEVRVPITEKFSFSENPIHISNNQFNFTTTEGKIVHINTLGNISYQTDTLNPPYYYKNMDNLAVQLSGNTLKIGNNKIQLPEGNYNPPKIYSLGNNNTFISIFNPTTQQVFLYNQEGVLLPYFPMNTTSDIDLSLSSENKVLLVITPEPNKISLYELN